MLYRANAFVFHVLADTSSIMEQLQNVTFKRVQIELQGSAGKLLPNSTVNDGSFDYVAAELAYYLQLFYTPLLVLFGLVGNAISVSVFRKSSMWNLSTGRYLSALAVTDSCFLVQLFVAWMDMVGWSSMFNWSGLCQGCVYTSYVSCNLSAWLVVAFTVERLAAVKCPLRRGSYAASRATVIVQILSAIALTVNVPVLRFAAATPHCNLDARYWSHADAFNLLDTAISFTIPLAAIVVMNVLICAGLLRAQRLRRRLVHAPTDSERQRRGHVDRYKVNAMLLTVSTVYVLLNLPAYSIRVLAYKFDLKAESTNERWITLQHVSLSMFHTNFGINLLLYCLSGSNFRAELAQNLRLRTRARIAWRWTAGVLRAQTAHEQRVSPPPPDDDDVVLERRRLQRAGAVRRREQLRAFDHHPCLLHTYMPSDPVVSARAAASPVRLACVTPAADRMRVFRGRVEEVSGPTIQANDGRGGGLGRGGSAREECGTEGRGGGSRRSMMRRPDSASAARARSPRPQPAPSAPHLCRSRPLELPYLFFVIPLRGPGGRDTHLPYIASPNSSPPREEVFPAARPRDLQCFDTARV